MKTLMNTAMKTIMKSSLCALAALILPAAAFAATTGSATKPIGASADLTTSTSGAVDSYSGAYATEGWYEPYKAFDGNLPVDENSANTKALIASAEGKSDRSQTSPRWIVYKFNVATAVNAIGVYPFGYWGNAKRCPMNWTFDASNDGSTWTTLDTRTGETDWTEFAYRYFELQNDTPYQYYRFYCTSLCGVPNKDTESHLELGELEFYRVDAVAAPIVTDGGAAVSGTSATITGSLDALGAGASSATVTLEYGTTAALGSSAPVGTYTEATDPISATLTGLSYGTTYYYAFKAVNDAPTPQTGWSETNSFVVEASTRFSDTLGIATSNCRMTVTGAIESWGLGTTEASLLVGASANDLAAVQTVSPASTPANDEVAFDSFTRAAGTWYVAVRAVTTYNGSVWTNDTAATAVTLADAATYTWKGGAGAWGDPAMWTTTDADAGGYPTAGCSVVFPADGRNENVVYLSSTPGTLAAITIDSASRYTFRSTSRSSVRTVKGTTMTMSGAGGGTLVLDAVSFLGEKNNDRNSRFDTLAGLGRLVLENSSEIDPPRVVDNSQLELSLVNGGKFRPWWTDVQVGKLRVGRSLNRIDPYGTHMITFNSFENIGDLGYCQLNSDMSGKVSFNDVSGIAQIGGEGTYENNPSQIKVAPEFSFYNGGLNKGIAAISNNVVVALAPETMRQGFDGATSLDNVYVASATTLTEDKTVNAVLLNADVDLDGHTLTVVSGVVRMSLNGKGHLQNGKLHVLRPSLVTDNGNSVVRFSADVETAGNADPWAPMLDTYMNDGNQMFSFKLTNFVGRIFWPQWQFSLKTGREAMGYVVDMKKAGQSVKSTQNYESCVVRGIAGDCKVEIGALLSAIWIGDCTDDQWSQIGDYKFNVVVSTNGMIAPGMFSYDGGRRGSISMKSVKERLTTFKMDEGGTLQVAIHADGEASQLKMSEIDTSNNWSSYLNVTLAGTLDIREYGKIQTGVAYPVVFYHPGMRTGKFANVTQGFKVQYDVAQPDGSYAVTVTKKGNAGTVIIVR